MPERNDSNPRRRRLGTELRKLRERAGYTTTSTAEAVEDFPRTRSAVSNAVSPSRQSVMGADAETVTGLKELARESKSTGWWRSAAQSLPDRFRPYIGDEAEASEIKIFKCYFIPGLLQTESYARELFETAIDTTPTGVEQRTEVRIGRQR